MSSPYLDLTSSSNSEEAWFATVKKQLRNPPIDTPLWPFGILIVILMFYIPTAFLIKDSFTHYWPEWHTSLIISVGALNLPLMAFWSLTILITWLYDKLKHQPTITSANPTYHRPYYVIKYAFIGLFAVEMSCSALLAVFCWWDKSLFAVLVAIIMMAVITTLRMRDWHPSKIWGNLVVPGQHRWRGASPACLLSSVKLLRRWQGRARPFHLFKR